MIQIRDVPAEVHGILKARAAREGMSLSDYLKKQLELSARRPTMREWLEAASQRKPIRSRRSAVEVLRELRESR